MSNRPALPPPDERSSAVQTLLVALGADHLAALAGELQIMLDIAVIIARGELNLLRAALRWIREMREAKASGLATNRVLEGHVAPNKAPLLKLRCGPTVETLEP